MIQKPPLIKAYPKLGTEFLHPAMWHVAPE